MEYNRDAATIPYFAHEGMVDRLDRINCRLLIAVIIAVVMLFASNALWLYCWMQYDYVGDDTEIVTTVDSEGDGIANGGRMNARRDSMGRYSRDDGMMDQR